MVFFGHFDIAQLALYLFWAFFIGLVIWLQRENMREGFPLISEVTGKEIKGALFGIPSPKTFLLPHGQGTRQAPDYKADTRAIAAVPVGSMPGLPLEPTGDPMADGVGPAAWAERADVPDMMHHGDPKIVPMRVAKGFAIAAGEPAIIGYQVLGGDGKPAGKVADVWIDKAESLIRYLELDVPGAGMRLMPFTCAVVRSSTETVAVHSIYAGQFAGVPQTKSPVQITLLEEEKIMAYFAGGKLFADTARRETQV